MENMTTYRNLYWDLRKSSYPEIDQLPLMESPGTMLVILTAYLAFVLRVGPTFMRKRQPYKLKTTLLLYNAVQVAISAYLVLMFVRNILEFGLIPKTCHMTHDYSRKQIITSTWVYLIAKTTELADTIFFVLRKKDRQVTFLHIYHHTIMVLATWGIVKYWPTNALMFAGCVNSLVHVVMYTYYGLAGLGPSATKYLTWKKYLTTFQLVQFVSVIMQYSTAVVVSDCPPQKSFNIFVVCNTAFFLLLFSQFYMKSYLKKKE
ncbi:elongation of very long chain fatty acids protein 7-like [Leguminivora glycinivorella]|uniref:elongation of very long chain fatty acids protein 7-like n=1 Tax=Leguminivora glycinivorella TaxID=1035111 RepID=UPI002010B633|nr:elongation of very long chain fatty acids protein 7-like [Leguminivora glycinivorella]